MVLPAYEEVGGNFLVTFKRKYELADEVTNQVTDQVSKQVIRMLEFCKTPRKKREILDHIGLKNDRRCYLRHIFPIIENGWLSMTYPNTPKHPNQRYVLTQTGLKILNDGA